MGATYTRQSTFTDGDVIDSDLFNNEYDQLLAAFASSTGHTHDGTAGEGGAISILLSDSIVFGTNTGDITLTWNGGSNDGVLTWMEDEDYFQFSDDLLISTNEKIQFRDTAIYINSSADGQLDIVADTEIQIAATTIDINGAVALNGAITGATNITLSGELDAATLDISGNADIDGNLDVGGNLTVTGTTTFNGGTLTLGDSASDNVVFGADVDSNIIPDDDNTYDLGSASQEWRNLFIDGTANIDSLVADTADINGGTVDGAVIGGSSAAAITGTAITGTSFVIGSASINENDLESIDDITAGTVSASKAAVVDSNKDITGFRNITLTGELDAGSLDISGNADIDGTLEADAITVNGTALAEVISDTVGAMVSSNTESGITVTYQDADNTLDFTIGTLNQNTTGSAATLTTARTIGGVSFNGSANINLPGVNASGNQNTSGTAAIATTVTITDNENTNENNAIVFTAGGDLDGGNLGLESDGDLKYNPSTGTLSATNISVSGTLSTVDSVTMSANNAVVFEGATADAHETTLTVVDATADRTITLPNVSGTVPVLAAASNTQITSTPEELNALDGITAVVGELNALDIGSTAIGTAVASKAVILDSNKDYTGLRNLTITGELDAATLDISGAIDVAGTTNLDVVDIDGAVDMASTLAVAGVVTANAGVVVDTMTLDAATLTATGDFTIDAAGEIILDADSQGSGNGVILKDAGTAYGSFFRSSSNFHIKSEPSDQDMIFMGNDGGNEITALTLDMSDAGTAIFNNKVGIGTSSPNTMLHVDAPSGTTYPTLGTASGVLGLAINEQHGIYLGADGSSGNAWIQVMREDGTGEAYDLVLQPSGGSVGIGTNSPASYLANELVVAAADEGGITLAASATSHKQNIFFADGTSGSARNRGNLSYDHNSDSLSMGTAGGNARMVMNSSGAVDITSTLTVNDSVTLQSSGSSKPMLTIKNTNADANPPALTFQKDSASPADGDEVANVNFFGDDSGGNVAAYAGLKVIADDVTDGTEDGSFHFRTMVAGTIADRVVLGATLTSSVDVGIATGADLITATAGTSNLRLGVNAGNSIASGGNFNVAVGDEAGTAITTGDRNTVVGYQAGDAITTGSENTALGRNAGGALTTGGTNTFVGADAGTSITTGASNTIIGRNNGNAEIDLRTASNRIVISDGGGNIGLYMDNNSQAFFGDMDLDTDGAAMNAQAVGTAMAGNFYQDDTGDSVLVKMRHARANTTNSALATFISFCRSDGAERGSIKVNGIGATTFNTSSDYRLKENVDYNWDATTRLKQLKPARFNFIADADTTVDGFLAHEAATVVPDAVTGVKDATHVVANVVLSASDEVVSQGITEESWTKRKADILYTENDIIPDGKSVGDVRKAAKFPSNSKWVATHTIPLNQQIDHSKIVPLLVKTIQELEARITTLEG